MAVIGSAFAGRRSGLLIIGFFLALASLAAHSRTPVERGEAAAAVCAACHQPDGNGAEMPGVSPWPRLAGLEAAYLAGQMRAFKSGARKNAEMTPFAEMLSDEQIDDVAAYYASLDARTPASPVAVSQDVLEAGRRLSLLGDWDRYIVPCTSCHGPDNQGVGDLFPDISGQHAGYIASQLRAWREGTRSGDPLGLMEAIAARMTDADITAVSAWLSSQPPAGNQLEGSGERGGVEK